MIFYSTGRWFVTQPCKQNEVPRLLERSEFLLKESEHDE